MSSYNLKLERLSVHFGIFHLRSMTSPLHLKKMPSFRCSHIGLYLEFTVPVSLVCGF